MSTLNDMDDVCTDLVDLINHLRFGEVLSADRGLQASGVFRVLRACEAYLETRNAQNFAPLLDNEVKQIRNAYASGMCREQLVSLKIQIIKN
ncbi:MAG: hypothetical protein GWN00_30165, partial [Aliifodinibius sp.]|nr:hypothetical protein [Fodinibius sp.]NIV15049.1 hypothetical protein [Fodinibius sp.]NIY28901.1 hypothetical protein [Fodinibius sp.]